MASAFRHLEILGPRASLESWLAFLQEVGVCHFADALHVVEGEPGVGRPVPRPEELEAHALRQDALRALRAVARILPPASAEARPLWILEPGEAPEALEALRDEAKALADRLRRRLEAVRARERRAASQDALAAGLRALERGDTDTVGGRLLVLPYEPFAGRRLERRLRRGGHDVVRADGLTTSVVVVRGVTAGPNGEQVSGRTTDATEAAIAEAAAAAGAEIVAWTDTHVGQSIASVRPLVERARDEALGVEQEARAELRAVVREIGPRTRLLLDALEDTEARQAIGHRLAATEHVVAARVYVRPEDEVLLRERTRATYGDLLIVRALAEREDAPTLPRRLASVPLAVLAGLHPARLGDLPIAALLAPAAPIATMLAWGDMGVGLLLVVLGTLLGVGTAGGSPRRDTAFLAQLAGLAGLLAGALEGRLFGAVGAAAFGTGWGLAPELLPWAQGGHDAFRALLVMMALVAGGLGLWGLGIALRDLLLGHPGGGRRAWLGGATALVVCGVALAVREAPTADSVGVPGAAILVLLLMLGVLLSHGARTLLLRVGLDLVGVVRLVAVGMGCLALFAWTFEAWASLGWAAILLTPITLMLAAVALVADAAYLAMAVPYDVALGGQRLAQPFEPLRRVGRPHSAPTSRPAGPAAMAEGGAR